MLGLFLQSISLNDTELAGLLGVIAAFAVILFFILFVAYIYLSLAYFSIGKRAKVKSPGLAWIPGIGPILIAYKSSKMHWAPWLLLIAFFIPVINVIANLAFTIFTVIWHWKMFEKIGRPGWWSILMLIPLVNLVMIGIAAWGKNNNRVIKF